MTEEEYEAIRQASAEGGARCVSEFVRNALLESTRPAPPSGATISGLDLRLSRVEKELAAVAGELHAHLDKKERPRAVVECVENRRQTMTIGEEGLDV
jgi:hypothetical protein